MDDWKKTYDEKSYALGYIEGFQEAYKEEYANEYAAAYKEVTAGKRQMEGYDAQVMQKNMQKNMVKRMLKEFSIEVISQTTGFSIEEIRDYKQKLDAQKA